MLYHCCGNHMSCSSTILSYITCSACSIHFKNDFLFLPVSEWICWPSVCLNTQHWLNSSVCSFNGSVCSLWTLLIILTPSESLRVEEVMASLSLPPKAPAVYLWEAQHGSDSDLLVIDEDSWDSSVGHNEEFLPTKASGETWPGADMSLMLIPNSPLHIKLRPHP